jgi:two-component system chemotaxis response regulator CheB
MVPASAKKRILIVDDSVVVRKILSEVLSQDPELEVAGTAGNGHIGLAKFASLRPDLILLDVEMPEMDGLETLAELRKLDAHVPIVMFSTLTEHGAATTLSALSLGASDYCGKPSNTGSLADSTETLRSELIPKIRALCKLGKLLPHQRPVAPLARVAAVRLPRKVEIVALGTSTGGPNALAEVIPKIPAGFPVPIVIVQHMPPVFTHLLAQRLSAQSSIPVHEAVEGEKLLPGHAWIAPGGLHMLVAREAGGVGIRLTKTPPENFCRPAVDVLFRSVAQVYGANALAVVLTGMGADGLVGSKSIRQAGGEIILQDEESSVVWGMPGSIYAAGVSDQVYPLSQIAPQISRLAGWGRALAAKSS